MTDQYDETGYPTDVPIAFLGNREAWDHYCEKAELITKEAVDYFFETNQFDTMATAKDIMPLMKLCTDAIWSRQYDIANYAVVNFPYDRGNAQACVTVLRSTYSARDKLSDWQRCVSQCYAMFNERGLDGDQLLRGLFE